ncbi:hypothetical protein [Deinococcus hopiensis]|uniref:Uncharacterized protein n=1 Tax=Deinococcus hopiensis KR-140 TaxID=695939 RepID=A0A1W1VK51_9DEIO|nr:hypothetical protein [Deinococcus hopiensis]SMB93314.1 hypothetical protein SAMN00790413_01932 [Deinococcus hopiensis KR-140]
MTAEQLAALLRLDFRPSDLGDTADQFTTRLQGITEAAVQRPDTTAIQQEAGARYSLLSAQLRQLTRKPERLKAASGAEVEQGLAARIAVVRADQQAQLALSGLNTVALTSSQVSSGSVAMEATF